MQLNSDPAGPDVRKQVLPGGVAKRNLRPNGFIEFYSYSITAEYNIPSLTKNNSIYLIRLEKTQKTDRHLRFKQKPPILSKSQILNSFFIQKYGKATMGTV